ncbi:MAG: glycosyltransferase family 4 protein [Mucilaginibacter sp.]
MRILIINTFYYPKFVGGAELSVQYLAEALVADGNKVFVICLGERQRVYRHNGVLIIQFKEKNIYSIYTKKSANALVKIIWHLIDSFNLFHYHILGKLIDKINPDIINTNNIQGISPVIWKLIKARQIKLVHTIRDYYLLCHKSILFKNGHTCDNLCTDCRATYQLKKPFFKYPDHFIGISDFVIAKHKQYGTIKSASSMVFNAVETNVAQNPSQLTGISGKVTWGYIGRFTADKGFDYLIDELTNLNDVTSAKIEILFAGKGEMDTVQKSGTTLLASNIKHSFLGVVKPGDFFSKIDALIIPSLWFEPFGRVVIEALSYGVPVCMSDRGGLKELYSESCCWLFTPTTGSLKRKIEMISNDALSIAEKGSLAVEYAAKFSIKKNLTETLRVYDKVLSIN